MRKSGYYGSYHRSSKSTLPVEILICTVIIVILALLFRGHISAIPRAEEVGISEAELLQRHPNPTYIENGPRDETTYIYSVGYHYQSVVVIVKAADGKVVSIVTR